MTLREAGIRPGGMRLLQVVPVRWFNAEAQYALDLSVALRERGHRVALLCEPGGPVAVRARDAGLEVWEEGGFSRKGPAAAAVVPAALRLARRLGEAGIDAVETHRSEGLAAVAWAARRAGVPVVRVRGDMRPVRGDPLNRRLYRRRLAAVVASNSAVARSLRARLGDLPRLAVIPGGVDHRRYTPEGERRDPRSLLGLSPGAFLFGILGRLGEVKGHGDLLAAARALCADGIDAAFVVLAKEEDRRERRLRAAAEKPPLCGRVGFLGWRDDLPSLVRSFDAGVVASRGSEANCRVGLEWMASGVPLVATRVGVLPDLVEEGCTGLLVPPGAPAELARAMGELAGDPERARRLGAAARKRVCGRFTLAHLAAAHERLLGGLSGPA